MNAISPDRPILSADDYEEYEDERPRRRGLRLAGIAAATLTLAGFAAVAVYGWLQYGGGQAADGPIPVVQADPRPVRTRPDDPGGMKVPFQENQIYTLPGRGRTPAPPASAQRVERLLPPPEAPMPRPIAPPPEAVAVAPPPAAVPPAAQTPPPAPANAVPPPVVAPAPIVAPPVPATAAAAPKPVAGPPVAPATGFRIQLAALRSSDEATQTWDRLRRAHPDVLGGLKASVVRIDLGDKGTFYRLQAGPLADRAAAADACTKLASERSACLVVPPS